MLEPKMRCAMQQSIVVPPYYTQDGKERNITRTKEARYFNIQQRIFNNEDALILVVALRTESAQHRGSCKEMPLQD